MNKEKTLIFSLSAMLFLTASFLVYSWSEPVTEMPGSYSIPLNTSGTAQTKTGELTVPIIYDSEGNGNYYLNPSGNSIVFGTITAERPTGANNVATKGYVDEKVSAVEAIITGAQPLVNGAHSQDECTSANGEIVDSDVSYKMCRFTAINCPVGWTQYKNFSTTIANGVCSCSNCDASCSSCSGTYCNPGFHSWGNIALEACHAYCPFLNTGCNQRGCFNCSAAALRTQVGCY